MSTLDLFAAGEEQLALERRCDVATGVRRRIALDRLHRPGRPFLADVKPESPRSVAPSGTDELRRWILDARFDEIAAALADGELASSVDDPWLGRAVAHAHLGYDMPRLDHRVLGMDVELSWRWPPDSHVNAAVLTVGAGDGALRLVVDRAEGEARSVQRIGVAPGATVPCELRFGTRSVDGTVHAGPRSTLVEVDGPLPLVVPATPPGTPAGSPALAWIPLAGEVPSAVSIPRRRRGRRVAIALAALLVLAGGALASRRRARRPRSDPDVHRNTSTSKREPQMKTEDNSTVDTSTVRRLESWAAQNGVADDPYVVGLSTAVSTGAALQALASLDPLEALPHPEPTAGRGLRSLSRVLTVVRNVAIFVPVALTWFGIRQATQAFGEYSAAPVAASEEQMNFLQFWQAGGPANGPSYLSSEWRIQNIALAASLLILGIVVLTLVASAVGAMSHRRDSRQQLIAEKERMAVAIDLTTALHPQREADPKLISESLAASVTALVAASNTIGESARRLERATAGLGSMVPHVDELNRHFEKLGGDVIGRVTQSVEALGQSVTTLGTTVKRDVYASLDDAVAGLDEVREQLARTSASVEFGTKQLRDDLDAIHGRLELAPLDGTR